MPSLDRRAALLGLAIFGSGLFFLLAASDSDAQVAKGDKPLEPKNDLTCLVVNKHSGRCLSVEDGSVKPGARIVQGPLPEQAGASERWTLLGAGKTFRLRNYKSRLVLEIGSANVNPGVQAIQWHNRPGVTHLLWKFEPLDDHYALHAGHAPLVLCVQEGLPDAGARVIQWDSLPDVPDQLWELRPVFQEHYWSFKGNANKRGDYELMGPAAEQCVKFEGDGLRVTLPLGHPDRRLGTGVAKNLQLKGDFEITVGFELLSEPEPDDAGLGTGFFMGVDVETGRNRATFARLLHERALLTGWFEAAKQGEDKPVKIDMKRVPTQAKAGQLRLTRVGADLHCEFAATPESDFVLIDSQPFSDKDVTQIRIGGFTGGPGAMLDARVIDLRLRAVNVPGAAPRVAPGGEPDNGMGPRSSRSWLIVGFILGGIVVFLFALALVGWLGCRLHARPQHQATREQPTPMAVSFACPTCGKNLKVKTAPAGRKLKCPKCGNAIALPSSPVRPTS